MKRGIAGSLIFTVFDRPGMWKAMRDALYAAKSTDIQNKESRQAGVKPEAVHALGDNLGVSLRTPVYADQLPPFDITLAAANEMGQLATMRIFGVDILNIGSGMSVDDIVNEQQATFVARSLTDWMPYGTLDTTAIDIETLGGAATWSIGDDGVVSGPTAA